jgi:predicted NodU family carbamoyl transferase
MSDQTLIDSLRGELREEQEVVAALQEERAANERTKERLWRQERARAEKAEVELAEARRVSTESAAYTRTLENRLAALGSRNP